MSVPQNLNKLREALCTIRDECVSHNGRCFSCPLALEDYKCGITGQKTCGSYDYKMLPKNWNVPPVKLMHPPKES